MGAFDAQPGLQLTKISFRFDGEIKHRQPKAKRIQHHQASLTYSRILAFWFKLASLAQW